MSTCDCNKGVADNMAIITPEGETYQLEAVKVTGKTRWEQCVSLDKKFS